MDESAVKMDDANIVFGQWCLDETDLIEHKRQALHREKREMEGERRKLEQERQQLSAEKCAYARRVASEKQLFEMKWKILEEELVKLAKEKAQVEKQRKFYEYVRAHETEEQKKIEASVQGGFFFVGVEDKQSLKKRYKDLLKIYHPDNRSGDIGTIQEINKAYEKLKMQYT